MELGLGDRVGRMLGSAPVPWLLGAAFVACYAGVLDGLPYNIDEGVNILYARSIGSGSLPYRDFFYHQTPLHLFLLALVSPLAPDSLALHRLPSLLATGAAGVVLHRMTSRLAPAPAPFFATALFYAAPLQHHDALALPNVPMLLFCVLGVYAVAFRDGGRWLAAGAASLLLAVFFKPLAVATIIAVGGALLLDPVRRWKLAPLAAALAAGGLAGFGLLHALSDGYFTTTVLFLARADVPEAVFAAWRSFPSTGVSFRDLGIESFAAWNLWIHLYAFWNANALLLLAALLGGLTLGRRPGAERGHAWLLALWLAVPFLFSVFVWKAAWDHYHVQYLPALACLGGVFLGGLWNRTPRRAPARALAAAWLVLALALGVRFVARDLQDYEPLRALAPGEETLFTLDPFLNFATGTSPACGLADPLASVLAFGDGARRAFEEAFPYELMTTEHMLRCLESAPDTKILISALRPFSLLFVDERLHAYVESQPEGRVLYPSLQDRAAFRDLFP